MVKLVAAVLVAAAVATACGRTSESVPDNTPETATSVAVAKPRNELPCDRLDVALLTDALGERPGVYVQEVGGCRWEAPGSRLLIQLMDSGDEDFAKDWLRDVRAHWEKPRPQGYEASVHSVEGVGDEALFIVTDTFLGSLHARFGSRLIELHVLGYALQTSEHARDALAKIAISVDATLG